MSSPPRGRESDPRRTRRGSHSGRVRGRLARAGPSFSLPAAPAACAGCDARFRRPPGLRCLPTRRRGLYFRVKPAPPASTVRPGRPARVRRKGHSGVKAIISDIHSNLEALQAVLADIKTQNITEIYCLGDIVGYGPNPRECIDLVMDCKLVLLGNHDQGAMFDPDGFNPPAERAIFWTRDAARSRRPRARQRPREALGVPRRAAAQSTARTASCSSTARPATRSTSTSSPRTSTTSGRWSASSPWSSGTASRATRTSRASSPRTCSSSAPRRSTTPTSSTAARRCATSARSASRATATGGPATSCSTTTRSRFRRVEYDIETTRQEDLRHPRPGQLPRRPPPRRALTRSRLRLRAAQHKRPREYSRGRLCWAARSRERRHAFPCCLTGVLDPHPVEGPVHEEHRHHQERRRQPVRQVRPAASPSAPPPARPPAGRTAS